MLQDVGKLKCRIEQVPLYIFIYYLVLSRALCCFLGVLVAHINVLNNNISLQTPNSKNIENCEIYDIYKSIIEICVCSAWHVCTFRWFNPTELPIDDAFTPGG
jgi:hypothetical protein